MDVPCLSEHDSCPRPEPCWVKRLYDAGDIAEVWLPLACIWTRLDEREARLEADLEDAVGNPRVHPTRTRPMTAEDYENDEANDLATRRQALEERGREW